VFSESPPLDPVLIYLNPVHTFVPSFSRTHFYTFFPFTFCSPRLSLLLQFSDQISYALLPHLLHVPYVSLVESSQQQ
jgi:hypothetical protein